MKFRYHKPQLVSEAVEILRASEDAVLLAGGMSLLPMMKQGFAAPGDLIDLGGIAELNGVTVTDKEIRIGAMTPHAVVAASDDIAARIPALSALARGIGDPQVRNRGTIGGSVANSDPAADYPSAVLGLGATIVTDRREIASDEFFLGLFETALEQDEVLTAIRFPVGGQANYRKFRQSASGFALAGVFVSRSGPREVRVAVTGAASNAFRLTEAEAILSEDFRPEALSDLNVQDEDMNSDIHASREYRAHIVSVLTRRCVSHINSAY